MASVGDKVRVLPNKSGQPAREGVVTGQSGSLLHVRWTTGEESTFIPGPGSVTVIGRSRSRIVRPAPAGKPAAKRTSTASSAKKAGVSAKSSTAAKRAGAKKTATKKSTVKKTTAKKATAKKAGVKKATVKKGAAKPSAKKTGARKTAAKKSGAKKKSGRSKR